MKLLLKLTSWQLFILLFLLPLLMGFGFVFFIVPFEVSNPTIIFSLIFVFFPFTIFLLWIWKVGTFLPTCLPNGVSINVKYFKISLVIPIFYWIGLTLIFANYLTLDLEPSNPIFIFYFYFLGEILFLYPFFIIAKLANIVREQRELRVTEYLGDFIFMILFPFYALVNFQPLINEAYQLKKEGEWN